MTGFYQQRADLMLLVGGTELVLLDAPISIEVGNDFRGHIDSFDFWINGSVDDWEFEEFGIFLRDSTGIALSSTDLPTTLNLESYDRLNYFEFRGRHIPTDSEIDMTIVLTSLTSVPEPKIGAYITLAFYAFLSIRRRRTRRGTSGPIAVL